METFQISRIPKLKIGHLTQSWDVVDVDETQTFIYETATHIELPHIIKFSGGRTSGMLLFVLLEAGLLKPERGDVVVFNNTSAEHPKTYEFVRQCKQLVESKYKVPFFWLEYQTYEDARGGEYTRIPAFRLVNDEPYSTDNPDGYHWRGEVFEELLSWKGYVPTLFQRTCTSNLKLECTRLFLKEWLANKPITERLGHFGNESRIGDDDLYKRHQKNNGGVPKKIFLKKKKFLKKRAIFRPAQTWTDFSSVTKLFNNPALDGKTFGENAHFGDGGVEYLAFVGLRYDEMRRVMRVHRRNSGGPESNGYEGEHVYMPFYTMNITVEDVNKFWSKQSWGLQLNAEDNLSNCTYCFLKGLHGLQKAHSSLTAEANPEYKDTPSDINWWIRLEQMYGRDMRAEKRKIKSDGTNNVIGFFGAKNKFTYKLLATAKSADELKSFSKSVLPCDCTD